MVFRALSLVLLFVMTFVAGPSETLAQTAGPKPTDALDSITSGFNDSAYLFDFIYPPRKQEVTPPIFSTAAALLSSGLNSLVFIANPCTSGTVPHFHPGAAEYFTPLEGKMKLYVYNGGRLIVNTLENTPHGVKAHIAPANNLHFFVNDGCERATMLATLNPGVGGQAGFFGYFNPPKVFSDVKATAADFADLIKTGTAVPPGPPAGVPGAFPLTNNCAKRCARKRYGRKHYGGDDDDK